MSGYKYRGAETIAAEEAREAAERAEAAAESPLTTKGRPRQRRAKAKCGTDSGYRHHLYKHTEPCDACRKAHTDYAREHRRAQGMPARRKPRCGTVSGHTSHYKNGEPQCDPCRLAFNAYMRRKAAGNPEIREKRRQHSREYRAYLAARKHAA